MLCYTGLRGREALLNICWLFRRASQRQGLGTCVGVLFFAACIALATACADSDSNADCPAPTAAERASYQACVATTDEPACTAAGGTWALGWDFCSCPTGQQDCRCSGPDDCLAGCVEPIVAAPSPPPSCAAVTEGRCASHGPKSGCGCWFVPTPTYRCYN